MCDGRRADSSAFGATSTDGSNTYMSGSIVEGLKGIFHVDMSYLTCVDCADAVEAEDALDLVRAVRTGPYTSSWI